LGHLFSTEGRALFDTGATDQALQKLKLAVEVDPKNSLAHANLGWAFSELREYEPASAELATAAALLDEESTPYARQIVYSNWGAALAQLNRPKEALKKFDVALHFDPKSAVLLRDSSAVALRVGDTKGAIDRLRRAEQLEPGNPKTAILLGQVYVATGDLNAALESFDRVLQRVPNQPDATLQLAQTLARLGRRDEAIAKLAAAAAALQRSEDPNARVARSRILTRLADVYSAGSQTDRAIEQYDQALAAWGDNFQANNNLAWLLATHPEEPRRNGKRAVELARQACELLEAPTPAVLGTMAAAYAANGQMPKAVETAEMAQEHARKSGDQAVVASLEEQLKAYRSGKLYLGQ
jgi:tetratricopeptide (TPR) repeat protein